MLIWIVGCHLNEAPELCDSTVILMRAGVYSTGVFLQRNGEGIEFLGSIDLCHSLLNLPHCRQIESVSVVHLVIIGI